MAFLSGLPPIFWGAYLLCMLLPLALMPLVAPCFWRRHWGKLSILWVAAFTVFCAVRFPAQPYVITFGANGSPVDSPIDLVSLLHFLLFSYLPATVMFFALLAISGGIRLTGDLSGTPKLNAIMLLLGSVISGFCGALVAIGLLIRPLLQANGHRRLRIHTVLFFIVITFIVSETLKTLFILYNMDRRGWVSGTDFPDFLHRFAMVGAIFAFLFVVYFLLETYLFKKDGSCLQQYGKFGPVRKLDVEGTGSLLFLPLLGVVAWLPDTVTWLPFTVSWLPDTIWENQPALDVYARPLGLSYLVSYALMIAITFVASRMHRQVCS